MAVDLSNAGKTVKLLPNKGFQGLLGRGNRMDV